MLEAVVLAVLLMSVRASAEIWTRRREERRRRDGPRAVVSEVPYTRRRYSSSVSSLLFSFGIVGAAVSEALLGWWRRRWFCFLLTCVEEVTVHVVCTSCVAFLFRFFVWCLRWSLPLARSPSSVGSPAVGSIVEGLAGVCLGCSSAAALPVDAATDIEVSWCGKVHIAFDYSLYSTPCLIFMRT